MSTKDRNPETLFACNRCIEVLQLGSYLLMHQKCQSDIRKTPVQPAAIMFLLSNSVSFATR